MGLAQTTPLRLCSLAAFFAAGMVVPNRRGC